MSNGSIPFEMECVLSIKQKMENEKSSNKKWTYGMRNVI